MGLFGGHWGRLSEEGRENLCTKRAQWLFWPTPEQTWTHYTHVSLPAHPSSAWLHHDPFSLPRLAACCPCPARTSPGGALETLQCSFMIPRKQWQVSGELDPTAVEWCTCNELQWVVIPQKLTVRLSWAVCRSLEVKGKLLCPCSAKEMGAGFGSQPNNSLRDHPDQGLPRFKGHNIISEQVVTVV